MFIIISVSAFARPVSARYSADANFRKAERAALKNGVVNPVTGATVAYDPKNFATLYVQNLYIAGKLVPGQTALVNGTPISVLTSYVDTAIKNNVTNSTVGQQKCTDAGVTGGNCTIYLQSLGDAIIAALKAGKGLSYDQILMLYGGPAGSVVGGSCNAAGYAGDEPCVIGYYLSCPTGLISSCVYYPIGTGPSATTAKQGDVILPVPPPGTVQARAVTMATIPETCDDIKAATPSTTFRTGTNFDLRLGAVSQGVKVQSGSTYVTWSVAPNTYRLVPLSPGTSSVRTCLTDSSGTQFGVFSANLASGGTETFDAAYGPPPSWFQAQGGDVYADAAITSLTSSAAVPRKVLLDGISTFPGVVTYGGSSTDYDFSLDTDTKGEAYVSSKNWLANDKAGSRDFYSYFYAKFGSPATPDYTDQANLAQPVYDAAKQVYYIKGNTTTSGDWTVSDGQKYVFLVDGTLTLGGTINITGNGFIAFIASGNIDVSPSVGGAFNSVSPVVEGVYITSGALRTGQSTVAGAERFVGRGIFVGNDVRLQRDLTSIGQNAAYAAELFIYNPALLVTMPDAMKSTPVSWQEVAP